LLDQAPSFLGTGVQHGDHDQIPPYQWRTLAPHVQRPWVPSTTHTHIATRAGLVSSDMGWGSRLDVRVSPGWL
jgi:hypothetical protein